MKFDSELWTSILQYIFFVINKPTFYHVVVVRFENYSVWRWKCKDNIVIKQYNFDMGGSPGELSEELVM